MRALKFFLPFLMPLGMLGALVFWITYAPIFPPPTAEELSRYKIMRVQQRRVAV